MFAKKSRVVTVMVDGVVSLSVSGFPSDLVGAAVVKISEQDHELLCVTEEGQVFLVGLDSESPLDVSARSASFQVEKPVECFDVKGTRVAIGGKENRLRVYDVCSRQKVFEARNPPDDWLCLKVPMWISGLKFMAGEVDRIVIVTRNRDVQMFDLAPEHDRRPVWKVSAGNDPLNCVAGSPDGSRLYCGSATGLVFVLDAQVGSLIGRMTPSCAGSVRDIACSASGKIVVAVGLDRFLYAYDSELRTVLNKLYSKQRLCRVLLADEEGELARQSDKEIDEEEEDDAWFGMPSRKREEPQPAEEAEDGPRQSMAKSLNKLKSKAKKRRGGNE